MPLQVNLPSDGITVEPNDMNGVTWHPASDPADVRRGHVMRAVDVIHRLKSTGGIPVRICDLMPNANPRAPL